MYKIKWFHLYVEFKETKQTHRNSEQKDGYQKEGAVGGWVKRGREYSQ